MGRGRGEGQQRIERIKAQATGKGGDARQNSPEEDISGIEEESE